MIEKAYRLVNLTKGGWNMNWKFESKSMDEVFETLEERYGENWDDAYSIKTEYHRGRFFLQLSGSLSKK